MFKEFEEYIIEYEKELLNTYREAAKAKKDWQNEYRAKPEEICHMPFYDKKWTSYFAYNVNKDCKEVELNNGKYIAVVDYREIDGKKYPEIVAVLGVEGDKYYHLNGRAEQEIAVRNHLDGWNQFLKDRNVLESDVKYVEYRDDAWIIERAHKDAEKHRKWIENKVKKVIEEVAEIEKLPGDGWVLKGTNGRKVHMWFAQAGGYNIQRLHTRCYVKEMR